MAGPIPSGDALGAPWVYWVRAWLIRPHDGFDMLGHVVANNGSAFAEILTIAGASVQVRGTGAQPQLLETPLDDRSTAAGQIPLIVAMGAAQHNPYRFRVAAVLLARHLEDVAAQYQEFCETNGLRGLGPGQRLFWIETSSNSQAFLADFISQYPAPDPAPQAVRDLASW